MADGSPSTTKTLLLQAAPSSETAPTLNKVSAFAFHHSHRVIANPPKTITESIATAEMPSEPETLNSTEQSCPFFKLSTELRLEIFRFAIQQALDLVNPPPGTNYKYSKTQTTRGALALLYTCRALRTESIDAMDHLAKASRTSLRSEIHLVRSTYWAAIKDTSEDGEQFAACLSLHHTLDQLDARMTEVDEVLSVLAFAREADEKMRAGGETYRAQLGSQRGKQAATENGQWVLWSGAQA